MTISRLRTMSMGLALLLAFAQVPAFAEDTSDTMPEVVRGSGGHAKPTAQKPDAAKPEAKAPCVPTPEARAAATVANGINGAYTGTRFVTGPLSMQGGAAMTGAAQGYGCQR